jgi:hypothetical protein
MPVAHSYKNQHPLNYSMHPSGGHQVNNVSNAVEVVITRNIPFSIETQLQHAQW